MTQPARWAVGASEIQNLIDADELEEVEPSDDHAERLLEEARTHVQSAQTLASDDPAGAYAMLYDGSRKALNAGLAKQGLRPTRKGGHIVTKDAARAQLDRVLQTQVRAFDRMRRRRQEAEYPSQDTLPITSDDIRSDLPVAEEIVERMEKIVPLLGPFNA